MQKPVNLTREQLYDLASLKPLSTVAADCQISMPIQASSAWIRQFLHRGAVMGLPVVRSFQHLALMLVVCDYIKQTNNKKASSIRLEAFDLRSDPIRIRT